MKRLHAFQREAAELIWRKLYRDDLPVVILADDVGLGKTYTALEVIRRATETGHTGAVVLCPARLESMWRGFAGIRGERTTLDDPLTFSVVTHERIPHLLDQASAPQSFRRLDESKIDLVVVDEAHAFKHERGMRATALRTWLSRGAARKVLLISATPVATSVADMLGEFAIGEAAAGAGRFEQRVGHDWRGRISATARTIERAARTGPVSRDTIVQAGLDNDLLGITGPVVIRRTRGMIRNRPDAGAGPVFPTAENRRETFKHLDKAERITYEGAAAAVAALTFGHYDVLVAAAAPGRTPPGSAAGLRRTGLLKQLETCVKTAHDGLRRNLDELRAPAAGRAWAGGSDPAKLAAPRQPRAGSHIRPPAVLDVHRRPRRDRVSRNAPPGCGRHGSTAGGADARCGGTL